MAAKRTKATFFGEGGSNAVVGADEFARKLRKMNTDLYKELATKQRLIAKSVETKARSKAGQRRQSAKVATAVRGYGSARAATLQLKERPKPGNFVYGAEFGSVQYGQFPDWKGNQWTPALWGSQGGPGYFFYPAINESREEVLTLYLAAVNDAARKAGISTYGGPRAIGITDLAGATLR